MKLSKHTNMKIIEHGKLYEPVSTISEVQFCPECGYERSSCLRSYEGMTFFGHKYVVFHTRQTCMKCGCCWEMEEKVKKKEWNKHRILAIVFAVLTLISFVLGPAVWNYSTIIDCILVILMFVFAIISTLLFCDTM